MKYYRVKKQYDGYNTGKLELVRHELFTVREKDLFNIPAQCVDLVEESKRAVYWFFGARFGTLSYN